MSMQQNIIRLLYPVIIFFSKKRYIKSNGEKAILSFYDLKAIANDGHIFNFSEVRNKKVLIVNTASGCGYTPQYKALQTLYGLYKNRLVIIAFPANDFKEQEQGDDRAIAAFCKRDYGITFPLMKKSTVIPGPHQNEVYQWLTQKEKNGWNDRPPEWNFTKYLVNEKGELTHYFSPGTSPLTKEMRKALNS